MSSKQKIDLSTVDLRDIVARSWGEGKRSGSCVIYRSRWRNDDNHASFAVYADGYKDFGGSGEHGSVIDWLRREHNWTVAEAVEFLQSRDIRVPLETRQAPPKSVAAPPPMLWQTHADAFMQAAETYLWSDAPDAQRVRWYLCTMRGLSEETIRQHRLGYNPTNQTKSYRGESQKLWLPAGITIPRFADGSVWAIRVRSRVGSLAQALGIEPDRFTYGDRKGEPVDKYLSLTGSKPGAVPFNASALRFRSRDVLIVEGEFDAALAEQVLGDQAAVITMGSATSSIPQEWIDKLKHAPRVYSCMDADGAGRAGTQRLAAALGDHHQPLTLPQGKDITEFVVDHGGDLLARWADREQVGQGWWRDGVPDGIRSALLNYLPASVTPIFERLNQALNAGLLDPDEIRIPTFKRLNTQLGWGLTNPTIDRAIRHLIGIFLSEIPSLKTASIAEKTLTPKRGAADKNPSVAKVTGRPSTVYAKVSLKEAKTALALLGHNRIYEKAHPTKRIKRTLAQIPPALKDQLPVAALTRTFRPAFERQNHAEQFAYRDARFAYERLLVALENPYSTPIAHEYHNGTTYRYQFIRGQTADRKGEKQQRRTRKDIAATLGISKRWVKSTLAKSGIKSEPQFEDVRIAAFTSAADLHATVDRAVRETHGFPRTWVIKLEDRELLYHYDPLTAASITRPQFEIGDEREFYLRLQVANKHTLTTYVYAARQPSRTMTMAVGKRVKTTVAREKKPQAKPKNRRYYGFGFDPNWVKGQLLLSLELLGWERQPDDRLINLQTGEIVGEHLSIEELTRVVLNNHDNHEA